MFPRILLRFVSWVKACSQFSVDYEEGSNDTLVFVRTWDRDTFRRVCGALLSKYSGEFSRNTAVLGQRLSVVGPSVSLVSLFGGSYVLRDTNIEFAGNGYRETLVEYPTFDLRLIKGCPQNCFSVVFGNWDPFSMTEIIVERMNCAEHRGRAASRHAMRPAVVSGDLSMPSLGEIV